MVGGEDDEDFERHDQEGSYRPPGAAEGVQDRPSSFTVQLPSQADEIKEISVLSKDCSEIMWEMVAMGETGESFEEMKSRATMLQSQLRGLISDYTGGDEAVFASAFEAFEMISRCLSDQKEPENTAVEEEQAPPAPPPVAIEEAAPAPEHPRPATVPPPAPVVATTNASAGADLISFD